MNMKPTAPKNVRRFQAPRAVAVAAIASTMLIGACGSSKGSSTSSTSPKTHLNTNRVASSIEQSILKQRHFRAKVSCPAVVAQEPGRNFVCVATMRKGVKTPFVVAQGSNGYVTYQGQ